VRSVCKVAEGETLLALKCQSRQRYSPRTGRVLEKEGAENLFLRAPSRAAVHGFDDHAWGRKIGRENCDEGGQRCRSALDSRQLGPLLDAAIGPELNHDPDG